MITKEVIFESKKFASKVNKPVMQVLKDYTGLEDTELVASLAKVWEFKYLSMQDLHTYTLEFGAISYLEALKKQCVILKKFNNPTVIALSDPFDSDLQEWASARVLESFEFALASQSDLLAVIKKYEDKMLAMDSIISPQTSSHEGGITTENLSILSINEHASHVIKLVNSTLYDAIKIKASDVHMEMDQQGLVIKYRLDGVLETVTRFDGLDTAEQIISRIKIMSELDIAERRVPQDGRFKIAIDHREVDFRVSIMPCVFGEDAVIRILDRSTITQQMSELKLEQLGFDINTIQTIRKMVLEPYGMVLVTGPTGSGKTTTLYAAISETNSSKDKIITIEDPVEYQLAGVLQIPVNEKKGLTFAKGLRSILRHDPDKIMVGEIRDPDTAHIAIQSALTGHLVFTTVHANSVFDVISRFNHMGVDAYSFVSAINGIISQRLIRRNCPHCAVDHVPDAQLLIDSRISGADAATFKFKMGSGCGHCRGTGFRGRKAIAEILDFNDEIRESIIKKDPIKTLKQLALQNGTRFLRRIALDMVRDGETTLEEINRVTFVD